MNDTFLENLYKNKTLHTPDVLLCLANLSNDEVFTPPDVANKMLDLLPQELFSDPNAKFLDPACKTGVFLREIAKRLIAGLADKIPDLQTRIDHIFHNQLYGIAITELTGLLSRRSVYCSKSPNGKYSVSRFDTDEGNIRYRRVNHEFINGKCRYCGANTTYDRGEELETHAYEFIHTTNAEQIFNMKFDVIISNPPYHFSVGNTSGNAAKAKAIYHHFISQATKLNPKYLVMISPSRWMTRSTEGIPEEWIDNMLNDNHIMIMHDYLDAEQCFPGVEIKGGVNYFLWGKDYSDKCHYYLHTSSGDIIENYDYLNASKTGIVVRDITALSIIKKITKVEGKYIEIESKNFSSLVSPKDFFTNKQYLTSSWTGYSKNIDFSHRIRYYLNKSVNKSGMAWVKIDDIPKNRNSIKLHKVYIPAAGGTGNDSQVLGMPFYGEPNSVCSQTYLVIGFDPVKHNFSKVECQNIISYIKTKFFRYLVSIKKKTQNGPRGVYQFVPLQNFSKPWTDEELYNKYGLDETEISFIEKAISPWGEKHIINDYSEFVRICETRIERAKNKDSFMFFRGQMNSMWALTPSILRVEDKEENYDSQWDKELSVFENIAKIQHTYENKIPTRLIDFTLDYNIALYFACQNQTVDGAIYLLEYIPSSEKSLYAKILPEFYTIKNEIRCSVFIDRFMEKYQGHDRDYVAASIGGMIESGFLVMPSKAEFEKAKNFCPRIAAQKGCFLICPNKHYFKGYSANEVEEYGIIYPEIVNSIFTNEPYCVKYVIPAGCKAAILKEIGKKGITEKSLLIGE